LELGSSLLYISARSHKQVVFSETKTGSLVDVKKCRGFFSENENMPGGCAYFFQVFPE
jgi:hypothetical protein